MALKVIHGGMIRATFDINTSSTTWVAGNVLELSTAGQAELSTGTSVGARGLANEAMPSTTATSADSLANVPSGRKVSVLLDEAVVETDQITSGTSFKVNDRVYVDTAGDICVTGGKAVDQVLGVALADADWTGTLRWLFSVQY